jgi:hypothetical protein
VSTAQARTWASRNPWSRKTTKSERSLISSATAM